MNMSGTQMLTWRDNKAVLAVAILCACLGPSAALGATPFVDHGGAELTVKAAYTPMRHKAHYIGEREQFGYNPRYLPLQVSFGPDNRPYMWNSTHLVTLSDEGRWVVLDTSQAVREKHPELGETGFVAARDSFLGFDSDGDAYMVARLGPLKGTSRGFKNGLLHSKDNCRTWTFYQTPVLVERLERLEGHNQIIGPPPMVEGRGRELNLVVSYKKLDGTLTAPKRILVGEVIPPVVRKGRHWITPAHSGSGNVTATFEGKTHVTWMSVQPLKGKQIEDAKRFTAKYGREGLCPAFVATYDHTTGKLGKRVYLGVTRRDNHNGPVISVDSKGYLHLLIGAHHHNFFYRRSLKPNSTTDGWTAAQPVGPLAPKGQGGYTYTGLVCDRDDALHLVSRYAGDSSYVFRVTYNRKKAGQSWEPNNHLVYPFRNNYVNWRQKISMDRHGRLFVSYKASHYYLSDEAVAAHRKKWPDCKLSAKNCPYGHDPCILISDDHGDTWRLAVTKDFVDGLIRSDKK